MVVFVYECSNNFFLKVMYYLLLPTIASLTLLLLFIPQIDVMMMYAIPDDWYRLFAKVFILFVIVFICDRLIEIWSSQNIICGSPLDKNLKRFFSPNEAQTCEC